MSDLHMWRQWLDCDWVRFRSIPLPTALQFTATWRTDWHSDKREAELAAWRPRLDEEGLADWLFEQVRSSWQEQLFTKHKQLKYVPNSRSWKMTQPLRDVSKLIDGLLRKQ